MPELIIPAEALEPMLTLLKAFALSIAGLSSAIVVWWANDYS